MITINANITIYRPVSRVFEFVSTPENDFQWQYETLASSQTSEGAAQVGTTFRSDSNLMGTRIQRTFEVMEYELNQKYVFKSLSGPLQSFTSYTFQITTGSTQLNLLMQANILNGMNVNENVLQKKLKKQFRENLEMLKNVLEAE